MRIIKEAEIRKQEIMDAATKLFTEKGYDKTSTNDILDAVGIARGTLYHHFKSKEDIMDALIERQTEQLITAAQAMSENTNISVEERMMATVMALHVTEENGEGKNMLEHLHKPQNALMHQKINSIMIHRIPPILSAILEDGIREGLFDTKYPLECMEMVLIYLNTVFDDSLFSLTPEEYATRIQAFIYHLERLLGAKPGQLSYVSNLFQE